MVKEKIPLINSDKKVVRIIGYVVYGFLFLMVLGALSPSEDTTSKPASDDTTTKTTSVATTEATGKKTSDSDNTKGWAVNIISNGAWSGSVGGDGNSYSIDGRRNKLIPIEGNPWIVTAVIQKQGQSGTLKVQILKDGEVKKESETSADYGVVSVTS